MEDIIKITNLDKRFGSVHAVNDLSFKVKKGELFAFLGVNGAGKSTTISIMCGLLKKDGGSVEICGKDVETDMAEISSKIGVVFQNSALDMHLSVKDNLFSRAGLYGFSRALFKLELSIGTPFDKRFSKRLLRDGIIYLAVPVGVILITSVISSAFGVKYSTENYTQFSTEIAYLLLSLICSYGAEVKEVADRNSNANPYGNPYNGNNQGYDNGNNQSNPYDDFHNPY